MDDEIKKCSELLMSGGVILYPTDTIWGIGCDATNEEAVQRIFGIKQRQESKSMLVLVDSEERLSQYVEEIPSIAGELRRQTERPTTLIYQKAKNLPTNMIAEDGTIAIRIVSEGFCHQLIRALDKPIVSTSANLSGRPSPTSYDEIGQEIIERVDLVVPREFEGKSTRQSSRIIKLGSDGTYTVIRE